VRQLRGDCLCKDRKGTQQVESFFPFSTGLVSSIGCLNTADITDVLMVLDAACQTRTLRTMHGQKAGPTRHMPPGEFLTTSTSARVPAGLIWISRQLYKWTHVPSREQKH